MEADWEAEIGGGAHVVEAAWAGFVDLRRMPEAVEQLPEAGALPGLAEAGAQAGAACYVDLLPRETASWVEHADAAEWCGRVCERLQGIALRSCRVDLVVRAAEFAEE